MAYPVVCRTRLQSVRESNDDTVNSTRALLKPFLDVRLVELARGKKARKQRYTVFIGLINQLTVEFGGPANIDNLRIPTVKGNFPIPGSRCRGKEYLALTAYFVLSDGLAIRSPRTPGLQAKDGRSIYRIAPILPRKERSKA